MIAHLDGVHRRCSRGTADRRVPVDDLRRAEGERRKQDKGSVSRHCVTVCLHIFFLRDRRPPTGDKTLAYGENPPVLPANCEIQALRHV